MNYSPLKLTPWGCRSLRPRAVPSGNCAPARHQSPQQWPNAKDASSVEQQRRPRAAHFVRAGTIENDVAVAGNLPLPMLHLIQSHVPRAADQRRVLSEFNLGPQIQNDGVLTRFLLLMQFVHSNPRHPQLGQQPVPLEILIADVKRNQPDNNPQRAAAKTGERVDDLFQLVTEQNAENNKTSSIEQRTQSIEEEESRGADAGTAGQGRRQRAQAGNELRRDDASHPVSSENILRPANARVRLQRNPAEQA